MIPITKTLKGDVNLTAGIYNFVLATNTGTALSNSLDNNVIEEVFIKCNVLEGGIVINLPAIYTFNLAWNTKIYISCVAGTPGEVTPIKVVAYPGQLEPVIKPGDTINGAPIIYFSLPYEVNYLHIADNNLWMCLIAPGLAP